METLTRRTQFLSTT